MLGNKTFVLHSAVACAAVAALAPAACAFTTVSKTFQRGTTAGLTETDRRFRSDAPDEAGGAGGATLDSDGFDPDRQVFIRYDNLFGTGANQIPSNAFIINASLTLTTNVSSNAQSGGPFGVSAVLRPWNTTTTTYNSLSLNPAGTAPDDGTLYPSGAVSRAVGFYDNPKPLYGGTNALEQGGTYTAQVAPIVQAWSSGAYANNGFSINTGTPRSTTDGWVIKTGTNGTVADRPLLNVTYTTAPVQTAKFQQGVNGYTGTTMSWLRDDGVTENGADLDHAFLDGWATGDSEDTVSSDDHALVKFDNVFTSEGGQVPKTARIVKAYLKVTTSDVGNAQTGHPYEVHQMIADWSTATRYTNFSGYGPRPGIHETTDFSANYGMIPNSDVYFDVTQAVESWQFGQPNRGFDIRAHEDPNDIVDNTNGTSDGWSIYFTGAADFSVRPEFIVSYLLRLPGDANEDGRIDPDDFALIDRGFRKGLTGWENGDFNVDGVVDAADYLLIDSQFKTQGGHFSGDELAARAAQFGEGYVASLLSVPEPATVGLLVAGGSLLAARRRR